MRTVLALGLLSAMVCGIGRGAGAAQQPPPAQDPASTADDLKAEAELVGRTFLGSRRMPGDVRATGGYEWLSRGRIYWVFDRRSDRTLVVAASGGGEKPVRLTGNKAATAEFLSRQFGGTYPGPPRAEALARFFKDVTVGPGGSVATREFLESQRSELGEWLKGREKDPAVFERLCTGVHAEQKNNEWTMQFNVFNGRGGVDLVKVSGTVSPLTIRGLAVKSLRARGTFFYPLEGQPGPSALVAP